MDVNVMSLYREEENRGVSAGQTAVTVEEKKKRRKS